MNLHETLKNLPASWADVTLKNFLSLIEIVPTEQSDDSIPLMSVENSFKTLSVLTGHPVETLEGLPMSQVGPLMSKIAFLFNSVPQIHETSSIKWKKFDEFTYGEFVTYQTLSKEPFKYMTELIKAASKEKMTDEQIENLAIEDVMAGFFLQQKASKKFLNSTKASLIVRLMKQKIQEAIRFKTK